METKWNCPHCGSENTDNQDETVLPLCGGCYEQVFWREIEAAQHRVHPTGGESTVKAASPESAPLPSNQVTTPTSG